MEVPARLVADNYTEVERKFLIADVDPSMLPDHRKTTIEQMFMLSKDINLDRRLRAEYRGEDVRYYLTEKYLTSRPSIGFKRKEEVGKHRFETLKNRIDPKRDPVKKTRWEFIWNSHRFRIDKYDGPSEGLLILEAVLSHEDDVIVIPEFCKVVREVTGDKEYNWPQTDSVDAQKPGQPIKGKSSAAFHIVALVDLLGQGTKLEKFGGIPKTSREKKAFSRLMFGTFGTVALFRERIALLNRALPQAMRVPDSVRERLSAGQLRLLSSTLEPEIGYQFFSDLALLKINLSGQKGHSPLVSLYGLLRQLGLLMLTQLAEGVLFRGAVEAGICAELDQNDLYGQGVGRAHALESRTAVHPRIVIGEHVVNYVRSFSKSRLTKDERVIGDAYIELIENCFMKDADDVVVLSYLEPVLRASYFGQDNNFRYVVKSACRAVQRQRDICDQRDARQIERLLKVEEYFKNQGCWTENGKRVSR
jgi:CYTH domain-containing protein